MELFVISLGILVALIVTAAVLDLKARRTRSRTYVDQRDVHNARRLNDSRGNMYEQGGGGGGGSS